MRKHRKQQNVQVEVVTHLLKSERVAAGFPLCVGEGESGGWGGQMYRCATLGLSLGPSCWKFLTLGEFLVTQRAMTIEVKRSGRPSESVCVCFAGG